MLLYYIFPSFASPNSSYENNGLGVSADVMSLRDEPEGMILKGLSGKRGR